MLICFLPENMFCIKELKNSFNYFCNFEIILSLRFPSVLFFINIQDAY